MNCEQAQELAILAVSGDVTLPEQIELDAHLSGCLACADEVRIFEELRSQLTDLHEEEAAAPLYAAVRAGVMAEIEVRKRSGWLAAWPAFAAMIACTLILLVTLHPQARVAKPASLKTVIVPAAVTDLSEAAVPAPAEVLRHPTRKKQARAATEHSEPLVVRMFTDDPEVVIYWIADARTDREGKEIIQ